MLTLFFWFIIKPPKRRAPMENWQISLLLLYPTLLILQWSILNPATRFIKKHMKDGKLKRILLLHWD